MQNCLITRRSIITSYFILPKDGKYSIFSQDFSQLTPYKYNSVQFYGDFAIGVFAPDDASPVDLSAQTSELIDLKRQQVITSVKGHTINVSEDDHYFSLRIQFMMLPVIRYFKPILLKLYLLQRIKHKIIYCGLDAITLNMPYTIIVLV